MIDILTSWACFSSACQTSATHVEMLSELLSL